MVDKVAPEQVFPLVLQLSPVSFILPLLHYTEKGKKKIIIITGSHNKPQGCGASIASAAGPFTRKGGREREREKRKGEKKGKKVDILTEGWLMI
jgi:hypothetical protein